jgi:polyferredoxin
VMAGIDTAAAFAIGAFMLVGFALMLFMVAVQPIWCVVDCAVGLHRSAFGKGIWIIVLIVLYGMANWFYGAFAAEGRWLRRITRLAWLFAFLLLVGFIALYNMSDGFRRGMDHQWQRSRDLMVMVPASAQA